MSKNPYDPEGQETFYNNWQAGYSADSKHECPYEGDDEEMQQLRLVWMKGFNASERDQKRAKRQANKQAKVERPPESPNTEKASESPFAGVSDELLMQELAMRKQGELTKLKQQKAELDRKIAVLEAICGQ